MTLCEYNGKRFMVSDIVWHNFKQRYPERAREIHVLKEAYIYFGFDDLVQFTNPTLSETKKILVEAYIKAENQESEYLLKFSETNNSKYEKEYEKYYIATEVIQILSNRLINSRITEQDINEYYESIGCEK